MELTGSTFPEGTFKCMKAAYDSGVNFFDTAEVYAAGESEKGMYSTRGAALRTMRRDSAMELSRQHF